MQLAILQYTNANISIRIMINDLSRTLTEFMSMHYVDLFELSRRDIERTVHKNNVTLE